MSRHLNEKCAVFGIFGSPENASRQTYFGLFALQHRGQEQTRIVSTNGKKIFSHKGPGLVSQIYTEKTLKNLPGFATIGHNRYSTSRGSNSKNSKHAQPIVFNNTVAFAHNGNLPSIKALLDFFKKNHIPSSGNSDSELMAKAIGFYMKKGNSLPKAVEKGIPTFYWSIFVRSAFN